MYTRLVVASAGAALITAAILLGMSEVAQRIRQRDPTRFFQITDIIPRPERGRPTRPADAQLPPPRAAPEYSPEGEVSLDSRIELDAGAADLELDRPSLESESEGP